MKIHQYKTRIMSKYTVYIISYGGAKYDFMDLQDEIGVMTLLECELNGDLTEEYKNFLKQHPDFSMSVTELPFSTKKDMHNAKTVFNEVADLIDYDRSKNRAVEFITHSEYQKYKDDKDNTS